MQKWFVNNWDTMEVSFIQNRDLYIMIAMSLTVSISLKRHPVLSNIKLFYHTAFVYCRGYENMLSQCQHNNRYSYYCSVSNDQAGVICSSK